MALTLQPAAVLALSLPLFGSEIEFLSKDPQLTFLSLGSQSGDHQLNTSLDLDEWDSVTLFVPEGLSFDFPIPTPDSSAAFFQLTSTPSLPLENALLSVSGLTLAEQIAGTETGLIYSFDSNGSGDCVVGNSHFDFTWTETSETGMTTVQITYPDLYREFLNIQAPADLTLPFFCSLTYSQGSQGFAGLYQNDLIFSTSPTPEPGVPSSLTGTTWLPSLESLPAFAFNTATSGTGPAITDGTPSTFTYSYIITGTNTATLEITDANGDFLRLYLGFATNGLSCNAYAASKTHNSLLGQDPNGNPGELSFILTENTPVP